MRLRRSRRIAAAAAASALALAAATTSALAHDFWLEPSSFSPAPGSKVEVAIRVGEHFNGDPVPRNDAKIRRFVFLDERGETPLAGAAGADPAGAAVVGPVGTTLAGYVGKPTPITLEADKFEAYLREEGLDHVIEERAKTGHSKDPGTEIYSRCAKAIVRVGGGARPGIDRVLGCDFELIPDALPATWDGSAVKVRAMLRGAPFEGVKVVALRKEKPASIEARTGGDGRATIAIDGTGIWLVKAVFMGKAPAGSGAEWESIWASVTFEVKAADKPGPRSPAPAPGSEPPPSIGDAGQPLARE